MSSHRIIDRRGSAHTSPPRPPARPRFNPHPSTLNPSAMGTGLYATPLNTGQTDAYRPRPWFFADLERPINDFDWYDLLRYARQLFAQLGTLSRAILQKNTYAVGNAWLPQFAGQNTKWGEIAREWLINTWYPNSDLRGQVFDFNTNLFLSGVSWDVDGDDLMALTEDEGQYGAGEHGSGSLGFPKLRFYSAWSISSGPGDTAARADSPKGREIGKGRFEGAKIHNGIIVDDRERTIGVRLRACSASGEQGYDLPIQNCQLMFEPEWRAQFRGIPPIGHCLLDALDGQDIDVFLKRLVKRASSVGLKQTTVGGEPPLNSDQIVRTVPDTDDGFSQPVSIQIERRIGGEDYYLQAGAGEDIEVLDFKTPSVETEAFIQRLERRVFASVGWFYELIDPATLKGAVVRLIQDQVRHSIFQRQKNLLKRARRAVQYAVARGMEIGEIPRNDTDMGGDFLKWNFNLPAQITVDQGYDDMSDQGNFRLGITTLSAVCEKKGKLWEQVRAQRTLENINLIDEAVALVEHAKAAGQDLTFREAIDLMQFDGPIPRPPLLPGEEGPNAPEQTKAKG